MARSAALAFGLVALCASLAVAYGHSRRLQQSEAPGPDFAPAPTEDINGVTGYSCPTPGSTGYLFQPAPCAYGEYAGSEIYCDEDTDGEGVVGIRTGGGGECTANEDCDSGQFCNIHFSPALCKAVATSECFAGAPSPAPTPEEGEEA